MTVIEFGRVLTAMADFRRNRAIMRTSYLGNNNTELLFALAFAFEVGAEKCMEIAKEKIDEPT